MKIGIERNNEFIGIYEFGDQIPKSSTKTITTYQNTPLNYKGLLSLLRMVENGIIDNIMNQETVPAYAGAGYVGIENYIAEIISNMEKKLEKATGIKNDGKDTTYHIHTITSTSEVNTPIKARESNQAQRSNGACSTTHS